MVTPPKEETDLVFAVYQTKRMPNPDGIYDDIAKSFANLIAIGHIGSTYWRKKDSDKAEIFRKVEPYLTFLNMNQLERQGADIQSKIEELEELNQSFRERDDIKDDALAHLSDQLMALTARMQDLEMAVRENVFYYLYPSDKFAFII